ncbi:hypothetical protein [Arthrobacter sp. UYCo732]|uniref:hypothetical protein n=1 Tax=Arthrobacter sp. UYCo732 TaxID=3156336 RepID=UPI0033996DFE
MTETRQPKGIPSGGQFAPGTRTEPDVRIRYPHGTTSEQLETVTALLTVDEARWEEQKAQRASQSEARTTRRRRLSGVRAAAQLIAEFPDAAYVDYTRDPINGITTLESIEDSEGYTLYDAKDMDGPVFAGNDRDSRRRIAARQGVGKLRGVNPPPNHTDQGISVREGDTERIHLPTALEDGLVLLEAEQLSPQQLSEQRVTEAMTNWSDTDEEPQTMVRDMLTDLRHYAAANNIDLGQALDGSYQVFLEEHHDPAFKEGF